METGNYNGLFLRNVNSRSKWLLSGTLGLDTLADATRIGDILGIHVATPDPRLPPGLPGVAKGPVVGPLSSSEDFRQMLGPLRSIDMALERHEQGRLLVKHFIRQNPTDYSYITVKTHIACERMSRTRQLRYILTSMELKDANDDFYGLDTSTRAQLKTELGSNRTGQSVAKELLVTLASRPHAENDDEVTVHLKERIERKHWEVKQWADKSLWLRNWMFMLDSRPLERWNEPESMAVDRANHWFQGYWLAEDADADYADHGGRVAYNAQRAALGLDRLPSKIGPTEYINELCMMTWIDFFVLPGKNQKELKKASKQAVLALAEELVSLDHQGGHRAPAAELTPSVERIQTILESSVRHGTRLGKTPEMSTRAKTEVEAAATVA